MATTAHPSAVSLRDLQGLLTIFTFTKKADLEKHCRELVIYSTDFASAILACRGGTLPLLHRIHPSDTVPEHLTPQEHWGRTIASNRGGRLTPAAQKVVNKIGSLFVQRRYLVGHMFYTPDLREWHFVYFDQRDVEARNRNHWKRGVHVHFVNWLWPNLDPQVVWSDFVQKRKPPGGALHVRYDDSALR